MAELTVDDIAIRFSLAAQTSHRLPAVRVQGYFSLWPTIVRTPYETMAMDEPRIYRFPPTPVDVEQMLEVMGWIQWLEVEQRHLVWMRAERYRWHEIGKRFACSSRTAQRRWDVSLQIVLDHLNQKSSA